MALFDLSPVSSIIDESCFADGSIKGSPNAMSLAPASPLNARSHDPNVKTANSRASKSPGASFRSKSLCAGHAGSENVSPSQTFAHVALGNPKERNSPDFGANLHKFADGSIYTTFKLPSLTHTGQKQDIDLNASVDQDQSESGSIHLSVTNVNYEEQKISVTEIDEETLNCNSDEDSSAGRSSPKNCSSNLHSSTLLTKRPKIIINTAPQVFKRKVSSIRSVKLRGPQHLVSNEMRQDLGDEFEPSPEELRSLQVPKHKRAEGHRKTSSGLSSGFLSVFNSVTSAGSSSSVKSVHQKPQQSRSRWSKFSNRSSTLSDGPNHISREGDLGSNSATHKATIDRALQRRRILGELISSETGYISDLKILAHVYLAMLGSTQIVDKHQLRKAQFCITGMIAVHEGFLAELKSITQDCSLSAQGRRTLPRLTKHVRFESIESFASTSRRQKRSKLYHFGDKNTEASRMAEPKETADVAKLFDKMMSGSSKPRMGKFLIYEEYGAMYAEVLEASASGSRAMPDWGMFERGIEALVHHVLQPGSASRVDKKGLTLEDLLIKPLQRICRYPLLFADLQSHCPAIDDPEAHTMITNTLARLREVAHEVNNATNDLEARARMRRTQQLADMLSFPEEFRPSFSLARDLGHAKLCGVLFVAYRSRHGHFEGQFMLCALFNSYLLLAAVDRSFKRFTIEAILRLDTIKLDTAKNGTSLQCHDTPYTWKMLFHFERSLYEIMLCACTDLEQQSWKSELESSSAREFRQKNQTDCGPILNFDFLHLELEPLVDKRRMESDLNHKQSISTFTNYAASMPPVRVSIRNTHIPWRGDPTESQSNASTSQDRAFVQASDVLPTLIPDKTHRARMEQAMSGVWTRDSLPFPAMTTSRSGQIIRASTSIMRRLSKASITSSPSKRSASQRSHASTAEVCHDLGMEDPFVETAITRKTGAIETANMASVTQTLESRSDTKVSRRISFSETVNRPKRQGTEDDNSETNTVIGIKSSTDVDVKPKKSSALFKASKERLRGWLP